MTTTEDIAAMYGNSSKRGDIDDDLLISLVKNNPVLYDKAHKDFKNIKLKKDKWSALSVGCGAASGEFLIKSLGIYQR